MSSIADEEVPHHPARGGEPEDAVALLRVDVQVVLLEVLEQDPALRVHDRLRQAGRARGVEDPHRVVERHALELELLVGGRERLVPVAPAGVEVAERHRVLERGHLALHALDQLAAVVVLAAVAVAVDGQQHLRLDLGEAVDDRARAEVRRAARPHRAEARGGEEGGDRLGDVRHVGDDAVAALDPHRAAGRRRRGRSARAARPTSTPRGRAARRRGGSPRGRRACRGRCAPGRRARRRVNHLAPGIEASASTSSYSPMDVEELPDRRPERLELLGRPAPQRVVVVELQPALGLEPPHVARQRRARQPLLRRLPEEVPLLGRRHRG